LLRESLLRAKSVEEINIRNTVAIKDLNKQLAQTENFSMSMKMKVKMRDSEIQRLKRKEGAPPDATMEEIIKTEVDAVKQELQSEVVKYKLASEELERRLSVYESQDTSSVDDGTDNKPTKREPATPFTLWSSAQEVDFQHDLSTAMTDLEAKNEEFQRHVDEMGRGMFLAHFGFTLDEAQDLKIHNAELKSKLNEVTITSDATKIALSAALAKSSELESTLLTTKGEFESKKCEFECEKLQLTATISCLNDDITERSNEILVLKGNIKHSDDEMVKVQQEKDRELRDQHNKLMKDNMILVQASRDLQVTIDEQKKQLESKSAMLADLEKKVSYVCEQMEAAGVKHKESICAIKEKLSDAESIIASQKKSLQESDVRMTELEDANQSWSEEAAELSQQLEETSIRLLETKQELESSLESIDNLNSQVETLIANHDEEKAMHSSALDQISMLSGDISKLQGELIQGRDDLEAQNALRLKLETIVSETAETLASTQATNASLVEEISEAKSVIELKNLEIVELQKVADDREIRITNLDEELVTKTNEIAIKDQDIEDSKKSMEDLNIDMSALHQSLAEKVLQFQQLESSLSSAQIELDEKTTEIDQAKATIEEVHVEREELQSQVTRGLTAMNEMKAAIADKDNVIESKNQELANSCNSIEHLKDEVLSLQDKEAEDNKLITGLSNSLKLKELDIEHLQTSVTDLTNDKNESIKLSKRQTQELTSKSRLLNEMEMSLAESRRKLECELVNKKILESELSNHKSMVTTRDQEIKELESDLDNVSKKRDHLQNEVSELKVENHHLMSDLDKLHNQVNKLSAEKSAFDNEKTDLLEQIISANAANITYEEEISALNQESTVVTEKLAQLTQALSVKDEDLSKLKIALSSAQAETFDVNEQLSIEKEAVEMRSQLLADATDQIDSLEKEKVELTSSTLALQSQLQSETEKSGHSSEEVKKLQALLSEKGVALSELSTNVTEANTEITALTEELGDLRTKLVILKAEKNSTDQAYDSIDEAIDVLRAAANANESPERVSSMLKDLECTVTQKNKRLGQLLVQLIALSSSNNKTKQHVAALESDIVARDVAVADTKKELELMTAEKIRLEGDIDSFKARESEEKSAKMRERFARLETISKLETMQTHLESIKAKYAESTDVVKARDDELRALRATLRESKEALSSLQIELAEVNKEKDKLCGHNNNKQKIQLHMLLKKNIEEQTQSLRNMQEQLSKVTQERDQAIDECRRAKQHQIKDGASTSKKLGGDATNVPQMVRRSQVKRKPLADATSSCDNQVRVESESKASLNL
jgi:chromosome segregation ATPase